MSFSISTIAWWFSDFWIFMCFCTWEWKMHPEPFASVIFLSVRIPSPFWNHKFYKFSEWKSQTTPQTSNPEIPTLSLSLNQQFLIVLLFAMNHCWLKNDKLEAKVQVNGPITQIFFSKELFICSSIHFIIHAQIIKHMYEGKIKASKETMHNTY